MDHMEVDQAHESIIDALPTEIWHQIVAHLSIFDLPSLIPTSKYFYNSITTKIKRKLLAKLRLENDLDAKYAKFKRKLSENFLKLAVQYNDSSYMEEFLTEEIWPWNVACIQFVPEQSQPYYTYLSNKKDKEPAYGDKYFEEILTNDATNVLDWMMTQFDNIEPEEFGFSLKRNGSFQLFLICFVKSLHAKEKSIRKLKIYDQAMKIIEKYSDILIRMLILSKEGLCIEPDLTNIDKNNTPYYVRSDYEVNTALDNNGAKYLQFLIYIHVTHDKYNLNFDTATADRYENDRTLGKLPRLDLSLALMLNPLELAYYMGDNTIVTEIKKIAPIDKNHAYIGWIIASGNAAELRYLNSIIKEANVNALFSPGVQALFKDIYKKRIESILGFAVFQYSQAFERSHSIVHVVIEWLLSNGAKFSENEISDIETGTSDAEKRILVATKNKYDIMKNISQNTDIKKVSGKTFQKVQKSNRNREEICFKENNTFIYYKKGGQYHGQWSLNNNEITCKTDKFVEKMFSGGSWGSFSDKVTALNTEFKYNVLLTRHDNPVLIEADSKAKTPTFNNLTRLFWAPTIFSL